MADPINIGGVLYEEMPDGQLKVVGYADAPAATKGRVISLPQNPKEIRQEARQDEADARARSDQTRQDDKARRDALEWAATHNPDGSPKKAAGGAKPLPDGAAKRYEDQVNAFAALDRAVGGFQDDYAGNTWTGGAENTLQNMFNTGTPGQAQWWSDFQATDNVLRNALFGASLTAGEKAAYEATSIKPNMAPEQVRANLDRRRELARDLLSRRTAFLKTNGYNPEAIDALAGEYGDLITAKPTQKADNEVPDPTTGADLKPPAPGLTVASGDTREVFNERLSSQVDAMVNAGASLGMINAVMKRQGKAPLDANSFATAKAWMKANPGKRYYGAQITDVEDMSLLQKVSGSDTGAFLAQMGNAATAGIPAALAGPSGQGALDAMSANSPGASLAGNLVGSVTGAAGAEAAIAARAPAALARFAPRIADTLFGGLQGFNASQEGDGATGALSGAGAGLLGGFLGDRALRGAAAISGGVRNPAVRYLRDRGIPLTVGQTVEGSGGVGSTIKGVEDALTSIPGVGNMVDARRTEGLEAFNRAAFQDAAAPGAQIAATGSEGLGQVRQSVQDAYGRALDPASLDVNDPQFIADVAAAQAAARGIPNVQPTAPSDYAQAALGNRLTAADPSGLMSGRQFQEAYRGLGRDGRARAQSDFGHEVAGATRLGQDALGGALERQNPGAFDGFLEANAANRRMNVLAGALHNAGNQTDELITPAQLNRADIASTSRLEGQINSAAGNRPFYDLATAGQQVLPSKLPDSGTAKRAIVGALTTGTLGGAGAAMGGSEGATYGTGGGLALSAALALGGTRAGQRALTSMIADRPDIAVSLGEILRRQAQLGGTAGAGISTALATQR